MAVPEEFRATLARWCRERVPAAERDRSRLGWAINGDEVRISERRAPAYPELSGAWTATPVARLRYRDPGPGLWSLYRPAGEPDTWQRFGEPGSDPFALLDRATR